MYNAPFKYFEQCVNHYGERSTVAEWIKMCVTCSQPWRKVDL